MSLSDGLNEFTLKLFNIMAAGKGENYFVSPYSISTALSMCLVGARTETAAQLKTLLGLKRLTDEQINTLNKELLERLNNGPDVRENKAKLMVANKIFPSETFTINSKFDEVLKTQYGSEVQQLNYKKANQAKNAAIINEWISQKTEKKIKNLVDASSLNELTRLVLVNTIYFKGTWSYQFDKRGTTSEDFHLRDGSTQKVNMMKLRGKYLRYQANVGGLKATSCEFAYIGHLVSMTIILPDEGVPIEEIEKQLNESVLKAIVQPKPVSNEPKVNAYVPKFKLDFKEELSGHLVKLGAPLAFDDEKADFTGMSPNADKLAISMVLHNAVVEVNEMGTEAAAATVIQTRFGCALNRPPEPEPEEFKCDRPFLFVIYEINSHTILFFGKHMIPTTA